MAEPRSVVDMIQSLAPFRWQAAGICLGLPVATYVVGMALLGLSKKTAARFLSVAVHAAVLPGTAAALIVLYLLFFTRSNVLADYDAVVFFGPIVCMALTLLAAGKVMRLETIPGFDRLGGLLLMSGVSFGVAYFLYRLAFRVWFVAPFETLLVIFVLAFLAIRVGARRFLGGRSARG